MTNWNALQVMNEKGKTPRKPVVPHGVKPRYMTMGSFHADIKRNGRSRRAFKGAGVKE